jgi:hypothetical protein
VIFEIFKTKGFAMTDVEKIGLERQREGAVLAADRCRVANYVAG